MRFIHYNALIKQPIGILARWRTWLTISMWHSMRAPMDTLLKILLKHHKDPLTSWLIIIKCMHP